MIYVKRQSRSKLEKNQNVVAQLTSPLQGLGWKKKSSQSLFQSARYCGPNFLIPNSGKQILAIEVNKVQESNNF